MKFLYAFAFSMSIFISFTSDACTVIFAGKDATTDGSVIVSHSDDAFEDNRLLYFKPEDHKPGEKVSIYYQKQANGFLAQHGGIPYRNYVINKKGSPYNTGETPSIPLGEIPQVAHTYGYFMSTYPVMNEHQLSISESTCESKVIPAPEKGKRIFYSSQLATIALQRCKTAKNAVKLMGELIEKYGYYGTGEALIVADKNEGWLIEMCAYEKNGTSGLWVAQRIPDNGVCVVANQFRIQDVKKNDSDFMFCEKLFEICQTKGWWNPKDGPFNWIKAVTSGEFRHPYYSLRRVWRALSLVKPSAKFSPWVDGPFTKKYPFSVVPDKKLKVKDIIAIHRDYYQGTEFDLSKGTATGPFGNPLRNEMPAVKIGGTNLADVQMNKKGEWERSIAIIRCVYYHVNQMRNFLPDQVGGVIWFGFDKPAETCVMPIYAGVTALPKSFTVGSYIKYNPKSAWWIFNRVAEEVTLNYKDMIKDVIELQLQIENNEFAMQWAIDKTAKDLIENKKVSLAEEYLTEYCTFNAKNVLKQWKKLLRKLYVKYNDQYIVSKNRDSELVGYPKDWLDKTNYYGNLQSYKKPETVRE